MRHRLVQLDSTGGGISGTLTKTVAYDDIGNILNKSDTGAYSYNPSGAGSVRPHAVSVIVPWVTGTLDAACSYDANGNMIAGGGRTTVRRGRGQFWGQHVRWRVFFIFDFNMLSDLLSSAWPLPGLTA